MPATERLPTRQQKHRRVPFAARVVRYDGDVVEWSSVNMSAGGMFVTGSPLLTPGEVVEVGVWLPETGDELIGHARVVWLNDPDAGDTRPHVPPGMGMELIDLDEADRKTLRDLLYGDQEVVDGTQVTEVGLEVGPYRILDLLGTGGMGEVFLAEHTELGRRVALKRLNNQLARDPRATRRFFDEGRVVNRLHHRNILQIFDFFSVGLDHYYVMELLEGKSLANLLDHGPLPVSRALRIGVQLCDALQAVHNAGVVHRDIKPSNILLIEQPGHHDFVKLLDFGVAKLRGTRTEPGVAVGTPAYMAPEQCLGENPDHRADLYAFGAVLFQMLTGRMVFEADTWSQLLVKQVHERPPGLIELAGAAIPRRLEKLVLCCLRKSTWRRPPSAHAIGLELRAILADIESTVEPERDRVRPLRPIAIGLLAGALVTLAASAAFEPARSTEPLRLPPVVIGPLGDYPTAVMLQEAAGAVRGGDYVSALELCHAVLLRNPDSAEAYRTLGAAYSHLGANRAACNAYAHYLRLEPVAQDRNELLTSCPVP